MSHYQKRNLKDFFSTENKNLAILFYDEQNFTKSNLILR